MMINFIKNLFTKQSGQVTVQKDWASKWRKGIESNLLQLNGKMTQPMRQSYVVNRCVNIISDTAPKAPLNFYRGVNEIEANHPLRRLFMKPSKHMSFYELISLTTMFYILYGESFWYLNESAGQASGISKLPAEIIVIDPRGLKEVLNPDRTLKGWLYNNKIALTTDEVIHFKSNNPYNPYRGLAKLDSVEFELKSDFKAAEFQEKFFENGAIPGFVLTTDKEDNTPEKDLKKMGQQFDNMHKGVSKSNKTAVLRGGMDFKVVGLTQREMSFIESRVMTRDIILETFGVPKAIFGATENVNRATAEVQEKVFWELTIQPLLLRIQAKLNAELMYFIDSSIEIKFDFTKIPVLQNLYKEDVESVWKLIQVGFSRNELNKRFDLGFLEDSEYGDDKYVMANLLKVGEDYTMQPVTDDTKSIKIIDKAETLSLVKNTKLARNTRTLKIFNRYHSGVEKQFKKKIYNYFEMQKRSVLKNLNTEQKSESYNDLYSRISGVWDNEDKVLVRAITPIMKQAVETGQEFAVDTLGIDRDIIFNEGLLLKRMNKITKINVTVWNQIKMNLHEGIGAGETINDIAERIKHVYSMAKKRATLIARTEVTSAMGEATLAEYKENNIGRIEWLSAGDSNVRDKHATNASVGPLPIGSIFPSGESYPGENSPGCRCCLSPVI